MQPFMKFDPCNADDGSFADNGVNYDESGDKIPSKLETSNGASQGQTRTTTGQRPPSRAGSAGEFASFWQILLKIADDLFSFWSNQTLVNTWIKRPSPKPDVSLVDDGQDDKKVGRVDVWCFLEGLQLRRRDGCWVK